MNTATLDRPAIEPTTALTLPQRAAVALGESANATKLRELVTKSAGILTVTNPDGRDEAHRAGMVLIKTRTNIEKTGKAAREDATAFSKAVIAMEKDLIAIIEPEETRVLKLRDAFDEQIAAEKAAKIAAERQRTEAIQADIETISDLVFDVAGRDAAAIGAAIDQAAQIIVTAERFAEFAADATGAIASTIEKLSVMRDAALAREQAAREAEEARIAEAARVEAERAENARQKAENERIANEQAAEAKRLADLAAATERNLQAERDAQAEQVRRANAELKAQQDKLDAQQVAADARDAAALAAQQDAQRRYDDHGPALEMNAMFDAAVVACAKFPDVLAGQKAEESEINADLTRCTETANAMLTNGRSQDMSLDELADSIGDGDPDSEPTDIEIIDVYVESFGGTRAQAVARLLAFVGDEA